MAIIYLFWSDYVSGTDLINSIASIIGLIVSMVAIYISIRMEKRHIKMDLFHKRYNFYVACDITARCFLRQYIKKTICNFNQIVFMR